LDLYEIAQVVVKVVFIAATVFVAVIVCVRVWRSDLDLRQLFSPSRMVQRAVDSHVNWIPTRETDGVYQDGKVVGRVLQAVLDPKNDRMQFEEIYNSSNLDQAREFEYQKWCLKLRGFLSIVQLNTSTPEKGQIIEKAVCEVIGVRTL